MTTLVLIRHAKSDWGDPSRSDHERTLNPRGHRDAPVMAERLVQSGTAVDAILTSTAVRARSTAEVFAGVLGAPLTEDEELYLAPASTLLRAAHAQGGRSVAVVAHDPGITVLAHELSGGGISHMPTCAVATFVWETNDWDVATSVPPDDWTVSVPRDGERD